MPDAGLQGGVRRLATGAVLAVAGVLALGVSPAAAHSLDSSTVSVHVSAGQADATITLPTETLVEAIGTDQLDDATVLAYLADHLTVTGADGATWAETFSTPTTQTIEGIESLVVDVTFDSAGASAEDFTLAYDAIIADVPGHEAVVVLTDAAGQVSTAGVLTTASDSVAIGDVSATSTGLVDMVGYGLTHVLEGADHLLFLTVLLLPAPLLVVAHRWGGRRTLLPSLRQVLAVATAFTAGHSVTLVAAGLGLVRVPSRPVEVMVALSVAAGAVHAWRPLVRRGEVLIAGGFGLVHGLAFAGILADLGLGGGAAVAPLLAFNVGVELAQLLVILAVFPSLFLLSRTRFHGRVRRVGAMAALTAASAWVLDRLGLLANPLSPLEDWAVAHLWWVAAALAALATTLWWVEQRLGAGVPEGEESAACAPDRVAATPMMEA